jgi:hypothetical protein
MALGSARSVTEMSTGNLPRGKGRPERKADNLTADYLEMCEPRQSVTGIALPFQTDT